MVTRVDEAARQPRSSAVTRSSNRSTDWDWSDRSRDRTVHDYYDTPLWYGGSQGGAHTVPDPQTRGA